MTTLLARARRTIELTFVHVKVVALNETHYRANLLMRLTQTLFQTAAGLATVLLVSAKTESLNGWGRGDLLAAVGVYTMVTGIINMIVVPATTRFSREIRMGEFDYVLLRPVAPRTLVTVRNLDVWALVDVAVGVAVIAVAVPDMTRPVGAGAIAAFVALLVVGSVIAYSMWFAIAAITFWTFEGLYLHNFFYYIGRAAQFPIAIYPTWLRIGLTAVIPIGIAITAPAEAITSRLTVGTVIAATVVAVVTSALSRWIWNRGVRAYSGASA